MNLGERIYGLDLFSGIGGNSLGLRDVIKTVAYCEHDKHAQSVLLSRMSDGSLESAPIWDDITTLDGNMFDVPIDIIIAGFPCQDISVAGKGAGLEGKRSGLFFEVVRLAKEIKPTFLFLENVPAIRLRGLDTVIQELTQAGYDCRWCVLSAANVGARHKRERWFLLAHNNGDGCQAIQKPHRKESPIIRSQRDDINGFHHTVPHSDVSGLEVGKQGEKNEQSPSIGVYRGSIEPTMGGVANGVSIDVVKSGRGYLSSNYWENEPQDVPRVTKEKEQRTERIKRLGNAVVPLQARVAFRYLMTGALSEQG